MTIAGCLIDSREPADIQKLTFGGAPVAVTTLEFGDLLITCDDGTLIAVERKTSGDFLNSLKDDRLFNQLSGLIAQTRWAYLCITGDLYRGPGGKVIADRGETGWNWAAVQGALLTAQELGVFVVFAGSDADYESAIMRVAARRHEGTHLVPPAKVPHVFTPGEQILASLPGIGLERVGVLLDHCGTPAAALAWLTDLSTTYKANGIGEVTKQQVRKTLGVPPQYQLGMVTTAQLVETESEWMPELCRACSYLPKEVPSVK